MHDAGDISVGFRGSRSPSLLACGHVAGLHLAFDVGGHGDEFERAVFNLLGQRDGADVVACARGPAAGERPIAGQDIVRAADPANGRRCRGVTDPIGDRENRVRGRTQGPGEIDGLAESGDVEQVKRVLRGVGHDGLERTRKHL